MLDEIRDENGLLPAYAWPGGYAIAYVMDDCEFLCAKCANDPSNPIHETGDADGWRIDAYITADWHEGTEWYCAHCNATIATEEG